MPPFSMASSLNPRVASLLSLQGRRALVTGASSGIGAHLAVVLHEAGADVVLCARRADRLRDLAADINRRHAAASDGRGSIGGRAFVVEMDVADAAGISKGFDEAEALLGGLPCDVIVNCAGIAIPKRMTEISFEDYESLMAVNERGAFFVAQEAAMRLIKADLPGSIINIASILGLRQERNQATYSMSKAAVVQMTKVMALELVRNRVRVNCICPGYFGSEMNTEFFASEKGKAFIKRTPPGRLGELQEMDAMTLLFASEKASSFITGVVVPIDGGHLVSSL